MIGEEWILLKMMRLHPPFQLWLFDLLNRSVLRFW
jgi:hypothetical protein